jgi:5-methylcytosine-specific restriction endonuclease McrA
MSRPHSTWRKAMFRKLVERDGARCAQCWSEDRWIWRPAGQWANDDWGQSADGYTVSRYTKVNGSSNLEVDHKRPLRDGGTNDIENLWLLCRDCHKRKTVAEHSARLRKIFAETRDR